MTARGRHDLGQRGGIPLVALLFCLACVSRWSIPCCQWASGQQGKTGHGMVETLPQRIHQLLLARDLTNFPLYVDGANPSRTSTSVRLCTLHCQRPANFQRVCLSVNLWTPSCATMPSPLPLLDVGHQRSQRILLRFLLENRVPRDAASGRPFVRLIHVEAHATEHDFPCEQLAVPRLASSTELDPSVVGLAFEIFVSGKADCGPAVRCCLGFGCQWPAAFSFSASPCAL